MPKVKIFLFLQFLFFTTIPVLAQVDTGWVRRYNGPGNSDDYAYAIAVDDSGNVYVTGWSWGSGTFYDFATIKYSANGDTAWVRRYNGPDNGVDVANAIALDNSGNVYVTGSSAGSGTVTDYATIKYYPNGDTAWVRGYNGPDNSRDVANAIAVDSSGNVYVTGYSFGVGHLSDYATIKYYPNGDTAWVRRYNGPGDSVDYAYAIAVDDSGNVCVTGYSFGSGTLIDYATIKYHPNGDTAWVRRYNGPGNYNDVPNAIAVDDSGNVSVTGTSYGSGTVTDYATIKYYPNGDTAWVRRYNGPANSLDYTNAIAVDDSGKVYVTGGSVGSDTTPEDYATIKYYPNGDTAWVRRYNGPFVNSSDVAVAIAIGHSGNVYVTGRSVRGGILHDYATIKYFPDGDTAWVRRYHGPANGDDFANAIAVDDSGNVCVTGYSVGSGTSNDYATIKYAQFICVDTAGDANGDGKVTLPDIITLVNYVFKGGPKPAPACRGDANADGKITLPDIITEVNYVFKGGPKPAKSRECCL